MTEKIQTIQLKSFDWWLWIFMLTAISIGIAGFTQAFYLSIAINLIIIFARIFSSGLKSESVFYCFLYSVQLIIALYVWDRIPIAMWILCIFTAIYIFFDKHIVERLLLLLE